ncbi:type I-E CRISPR-associated protein Cse1/CasA [Amycolatopsis panacis]|uniref:Type I-E CRISPR-associated protein Cse1/CasA n=1 Tax=Amycolatopsis panacis TaxID=2340917 RepID=A0A419I9A4_9PSEU|nr:type I-E CRISPR-associated protein Cse1/CasA [Amycolatopsis panacis]RJQ89106.1 type I-E CRISPR-associated protein Cse1/CasA [Amycolatopsis panacis]
MNVAEPVSFDLTDQPWLPARTLAGEQIELSLVDVLVQAHTLSGLTCEVGTQMFALTRLLLAVLHGAVDGPRDVDHWERLWSQETLPADAIKSYLAKCRDRFDLFHPQTPFLQVAGLRTAKGEVSELNKLIADVPNGHPFFTTRIGGPLRLSYAEAARWLVHCHAFDPSGIKSGAEGDPRVKGGKGYPIGTGWSGNLGGVLPEGRTLRETLLLNLIAAESVALRRDPAIDLPVWERKPAGVTEEQEGGRAPAGPVDLYTWQSRRIRLVREDGAVTAVLICNGERSTPQNKNLVEPHTAWRRSQAQEKKLRQPLVYMPREHLPERAVWRGLQSLLPGAETGQGSEAAAFLSPGVLEWVAEVADIVGPDQPLRLHTVGMTYGAQSSTTSDILDDHIELRSILISRGARALVQTALDSVAAAENGALAVSRLASNLAAATGAGKDDRDGPRERASERCYAALDIEFRAWLRGLRADTDPIEAARAWHTTANRSIRALGAELLEQAPMTAWSGRIVNGHLLTSAHADRYFRKAVRDAFPFAYNDDSEAAS